MKIVRTPFTDRRLAPPHGTVKSVLLLHEIQGVVMVTPTNDFRKRNMVRLWTHESLRVFGDRLVDDADREWFLQHLNNMVSSSYSWNLAVHSTWGTTVGPGV